MDDLQAQVERDIFRTGWFGVPGRATYRGKVHVVRRFNYKPVCGAQIGPNARFQFSAAGVRRSYVDCKTCRGMIDSLHERISNMLTGATL